MALPEKIFAHASPLSIRGRSLFQASPREIASFGSVAFVSAPPVVATATKRLELAGFEILQVTPLTINIAGPPDLFQEELKCKIYEREMPQADRPSVTFLDTRD